MFVFASFGLLPGCLHCCPWGHRMTSQPSLCRRRQLSPSVTSVIIDTQTMLVRAPVVSTPPYIKRHIFGAL